MKNICVKIDNYQVRGSFMGRGERDFGTLYFPYCNWFKPLILFCFCFCFCFCF